MNNKRATKRALLTSVMALVMCVVMLVGTTFAWFTDTASTGVNKIQAGNLKVDIVKSDNNGSIKGESMSFVNKDGSADILWEPGVTFRTPGFKIKNDGNLALKYKLALNGVTGSSKLLEVIKFSVVTAGTTDNSFEAVDIDRFEGHLAAGETSSTVLYIQGHMDKNAGNEYQGLELTGLGITVYATQDNVENDSFGPDYDKNATYYPVLDAAGMKDALVNGGNIKVDANVDPSEALVATKETTIDMNGKTIENTTDIWNESAAEWSLVSARENADLTITGNGTFAAKENDCYAVDVQDGATVTIENGTFIGNIHAVYVLEGTAYIKGGFYSVQQKYPEAGKENEFVLNCYDANRANGTAKIIVTGGTFVNFNPANCQAEGPNTNFVPAGYSVITETKANGDKWYTVVKGTGVTAGTQEGLNNAISSNTVATVKLTEDGTYNLTDGIAKSKDVTFIGTKDTVIDVCQNLDGESGVNAGMNYQDGATLVFKGVTILGQVSGNYGGIVRAATTFEDCTIKGKLTLYGDTTFINCTFENQNDYSIWTWGAKNVTFEGCTFMTGGKAINLYGGADHPGAPTTVLTVNNCIFNDSNNGATGKAAIEVGNDYGATYILTVNNVTVNGFAVNTEGEDTGSRIWANKKSMDAAHLTVTIDGNKVQ